MIDLRLLQILKYKDEYKKLIGRVPEESLEKTTVSLLRDFGKYFDRFPEHDSIDFQTFLPLFNSWHPKMSKEQKNAYGLVLQKVKKDMPEDDKDAVMHSMLELRLSSDVGTLLLKFDEGEVRDIHGALNALQETFKKDARIKTLDYLRVDVDELLNAEINDDGMRWRLSCLNENMRGLRPGDFGIVGGRPDKGKTTFLASELTKLAEQSEKPIIWLNNEGPGNRIYPRLWQAALGLQMSQLIQLNASKQLIPKYMEQLQTDDPYKIRVIDIHGQDNYAVERMIEKNEPSIIVYDMIDKVKGFHEAGRTDEVLEAKYDWARDACVNYECAGIATSQISVDGANMQFPADYMLKDSKTGKQGACDFICMIGSVDDPGYSAARFIGLPKNKLRREGSSGDPKATVRYKPQIARYEDLAMIEEDGELPDE